MKTHSGLVYGIDVIAHAQKEGNSEKIFVLDTNVLIDQPFAPWLLSGNQFPDEKEQRIYERRLELQGAEFDPTPNTVIIPSLVLSELDGLKSNTERRDVARKARRATSALEELIDSNVTPLAGYTPLSMLGRIRDGLAAIGVGISRASAHPYNSYTQLENGANIFVLDFPYDYRLRASNLANIDDLLISAAGLVSKDFPQGRFISNDRMVRLKSGVRQVPAESFNYVSEFDPNQLFTSVTEITPEFFETETRNLLLNNQSVTVSVESLRDKVGNVLIRPVHVFGVGESDGTSDDVTDYIIGKVDPNLDQDYKTADMTLVRFDPERQFIGRLKKHNARVRKNADTAQTSSVSDFNPAAPGAHEVLKQYLSKNRDELKPSVPSDKRLINNISKVTDKTTVSRMSNLHDTLTARLKNPNAAVQKNVKGKVITETPLEKPLSLKEVRQGVVQLNTLYKPIHNQIPYLSMLLDTEIDLITACGPAGTAKTYYALLAGLLQLQEGIVDKILYVRPLASADEGLGFYKGGKDEKMSHWMKPADMSLLSAMGPRGYENISLDEKAKSDKMLARLKASGLLEYEVMTEMRGTTYNRTYAVLDEAQSASEEQLRLVVGRMGKESRLVCTGDFDQTDTSYTRGRSNFYTGLAVAIESLAEEPRVAHINLTQSAVVRGRLAGLAGKIRS